MCGINGIFAFHPASSLPRENELVATRDAMASRGPDGEGLWWIADRRCALAHRRLSILDLSDRAAQPMASANGRFVVTFNGEIYNYPALRAELAAEGVRFRTTSDTEALLHLYARDGHAMVKRLRGMFALAIWDNETRELFLARDPYGIKPLYTANDGWTFRFASQVKALLAGGHVSRELEPAGIVSFHLFGSVSEPFTLHRDIRALPAGHIQRIDAAGPKEPEPYANLAAILTAGAQHTCRAPEVAQRVREAVTESVRAHLLADVEVGLFLSAGLDSTALLGIVRDAGRTDVRALTLAFAEFSGTAEDEAPLAQLAAERYGARHIVRRVDQAEFERDLPAIFEAMDQPTIDGVNTWFVAKAAKEAGLKVALSGVGGDELLAGYPSFADLPRWRRRFGRFSAVPGLGYLARAVIQNLLPGVARSQPKASAILEYSRSWAGTYLLRRGLFLPHELTTLMEPGQAREGLRRLKPLQRLGAALSPEPPSDTSCVSALESTQYLRNQLLRDADWAGMAHGVEIRTPLVDATLLSQLAAAVPHFASGRGKAVLAAAPLRSLPNEILTRAKTGFAVPTGSWLSAAAASRQGGEKANKGVISRRWSRVVLSSVEASRVACAG